jgi:ABC-2 type transport system ATP-binding protein
MSLAVEIQNLSKFYKTRGGKGNKKALENVDLEIPEGSFFGLLGPNGAGKSTLINIIAGLVNKSSGNVKICGYDLDEEPLEVRRSIGVVPQEVVIDPFFSVYETLEYYAGYFGVRKRDRRTEELLKALSLYDKKDVGPRRLSGGMRRRLLIAKALVHKPKILILDEPTAGVDVELRLNLWDYVKKLNEEGTTVLLTTHYLEEAEQLCDQISIINHGKVIANDSTKNLIKNLGTKDIIFFLSEAISEIPEELKDSNAQIINEGYGIRVTYNFADGNMDALLSKICDAGIVIKDISTEETDLEDVFRILVKDAA